MSDNTRKEIQKLEALRSLLLDNFLELAANGDLTPTDRRTLASLLKDNGMTIDPTSLPQSLRDKLAGSIPVDADIDEDMHNI